jgi:hypothetical protein
MDFGHKYSKVAQHPEPTGQGGSLRHLRDIFSDKITMAAGIVFLLILVLVVFNTASSLPERVPLLGVFSYGAVLVLFIAGGIIFVLALLRS